VGSGSFGYFNEYFEIIILKQFLEMFGVQQILTLKEKWRARLLIFESNPMKKKGKN
jgi:hypothetical protein